MKLKSQFLHMLKQVVDVTYVQTRDNVEMRTISGRTVT